ncbi:TPA: hypothetical protein ACPY23_004697, partial [Klebsiella oxytoca]|uniref:hypothetical protein n=1 Tax=Klebsiella oxytoca TaxID=571 RepID=UPI002247D830
GGLTAEWQNFPEAMQAHLSGYWPTSGCEPVARLNAVRAGEKLRHRKIPPLFTFISTSPPRRPIIHYHY